MPDILDQSTDEQLSPNQGGVMEDVAPEVTWGPGNGDPKYLKLPEDRIDQLRSLCNKLNLRDQYARQIEIMRCALKRYFWLGLQHVWWNSDASCFQVGQAGGAVVAEDLNQESTAQQDFNIFKPNGKIFTSVFSQNPATVRMEPDQPNESQSIRAAAEAEKYLKVYDKYNPPQDAQITVGRLLWTDGRVVSVTEASADGMSERTCYDGVLEWKVPIYETEFKNWPYAKRSKDHDVLTMKWKHPEVADKISIGGKAASPNDEIARMARVSTAEGITQLSHDTLQYLVTEDGYWLRPMAFSDMPKEDRRFWIGGDSESEDEEQENVEPGVFPNGCKLTFCGETYCGADSVSMDDALDVMHAEPGEGQARNSLGDPHVPVQMEFNDAMNLTAELLKFCVPSLWADIDETEFAAIREQLAQYGQIRPKKRKTSEPMENDFFPEPQVEAPGILAEWIQNLQGPLTQLVTLNQPAMFGANMEDQKTAQAYQQALQQSLGVLTIVWVPFQTFAAHIREQAAKIASARDQKFSTLVPGSNNKTETVEIDPIVLRGGFTCSAVPCQGFPESWTSKSQTIKGLMAAAPTNPVLAAALQLPSNLVLQRDAIGIPEMELEGADSRDKQLQEWAEMQKGEGPEFDQQATQQRDEQRQQMAEQLAQQVQPGRSQTLPPPPALPPVMKSSIPVDPDAEDHVAEALECFRILNSPEGLKIKGTLDLDAKAAPVASSQPNDSKRKGFAIWTDLKLHMLAHIAAGKAKGLIFPPPLAGPPLPSPGAIAPPNGAAPGAAGPKDVIPPPTNPGGSNAAHAA